jgi:hypothetical protein
LLSRRGCSLPANASGFDPHRASISIRFGQVKFFPHEVRDLEPAFELLLAQGAATDTTHWESRYVLWLW